MKTKPFNLEAAQAGDPIQSKAGKAYTFVAHVPQARNDQKVVVVDNDGILECRFANGQLCLTSACTSDLVMAPKKKELWINIYGTTHAIPYPSKEAADKNAYETRLACVRVEYEA